MLATVLPREAPAAERRVPSEFVGRARQFRQAVLAADTAIAAGLPGLLGPLQARLNRKPTLRPAMVVDLIRRWPEVIPDRYCLARNASVDKNALTISEVRIAASHLHNPAWDGQDWEHGISVAKLNSTTGHGQLRLTVTPVASVSLHALARRYQRSIQRDHAAVIRDLKALARHPQSGKVFTDTGCWCGRVVTTRHEVDGEPRPLRLLAIRTFIGNDT
jgi:hypothetical protein